MRRHSRPPLHGSSFLALLRGTPIPGPPPRHAARSRGPEASSVSPTVHRRFPQGTLRRPESAGRRAPVAVDFRRRMEASEGSTSKAGVRRRGHRRHHRQTRRVPHRRDPLLPTAGPFHVKQQPPRAPRPGGAPSWPPRYARRGSRRRGTGPRGTGRRRTGAAPTGLGRHAVRRDPGLAPRCPANRSAGRTRPREVDGGRTARRAADLRSLAEHDQGRPPALPAVTRQDA
jgi:hypothetical protein